jgi:hypothetical protein
LKLITVTASNAPATNTIIRFFRFFIRFIFKLI